MNFSLEKHEEYSVFTWKDTKITSISAPELKAQLLEVKNNGLKNIILDLTCVKFVDSSGLSAILSGDRLWRDEGTYIVGGVSHPMVVKLFDISKLDSVLTIIPTLEESMDYMNMELLEQKLSGE